MGTTRDFVITLYTRKGDPITEIDAEARYELSEAGYVEIAGVGVYYGPDVVELESGDPLWREAMDGAEALLNANHRDRKGRFTACAIAADLTDEMAEYTWPGSGITSAQSAWLHAHAAE